MRLPPIPDRVVRSELRRTNYWLRMLGSQMGRTVTLPQGTPSAITNDVDLSNYLYLPGRDGGQISSGRVRFAAKVMPAGGTSVPDTAQRGFGLLAPLDIDGPTSVNFWVEDSLASLSVLRPTREWVIPAFNQIEGETAGVHYFADTSDFQVLSNKTITGSIVEFGFTSKNALLDAQTESKLCYITLENLSSNRNTTTHASTATPPGIQIPAMDILTGLGNNTFDKTHTFGVVKTTLSGSNPTSTPFEISGLVYGGDTRQELYCMPGAAKGTLPAPTQGQFVVWNPAISFTGNVSTGFATITNMSTTAGLVVGMRIRDVRTNTAYAERFLVSIDAPGPGGQITVSAAFSETTNGLSFVGFGMTYLSASGITGIAHSSLTGLLADDHTQYLALGGRGSGQVFGTGGPYGGSTLLDLAMTGRLLLGNNLGAGFVTNRFLEVKGQPNAPATTTNITMDMTNVAATGTTTCLQVSVSGSVSTAGTSSVRGFFFTSSAQVGTGATVSESLGALIQSTAGTSGGTITKATGVRILANGDAISSSTTPTIVGLEISIAPKLAAVTDYSHLSMIQSSTPFAGGTVTNYRGIDFGATANQDNAAVTNWTALRIPAAPTNPTGTIRGLEIGDILSHHVGKFRHGSTAAPAHFVDIAAGTTTVAPIRLASGTNLTTAVAGCGEYDGSFFYLTHSDAVRTKTVTQRGEVNATAQGAAIGATTLYAAPASGYYVVYYTLETTTADNVTPAVSVQFQVNYTDDIGATNQTGAALSLAATGRDRGSFQVWCNAGQNIQYQTNVVTIGTAKYALRVRLGYLG